MTAAGSDLIQAIRGPIMLIAVGVLVSLEYFQGISFTRRTWPVLLIVFGLLKLLERAVRPSYPESYPSNPGMPPGGYRT